MKTEASLDALVDVLLAHVEPVATELIQDPEDTIEAIFPPVRIRALPDAWTSDECSCDGFYAADIDPLRPWIVFDSSVTPRRRAHTLLHELGHHLVATECCELLEDLDRIAGDEGNVQSWEERLCHRFAARLLIPDALVDEVVGDATSFRPEMVGELVSRGNASWESSAWRIGERLPPQTWIVLLREPGFIAFCAGSFRRGESYWHRGSRVQPGGALSLAFGANQRARPDVFRYEMAYPVNCYTDSLKVHDELVVAMMSTHPSVRRVGQAFPREEPEPLWKVRDEVCPECGEEFAAGWCDACSRRRCQECGWCGCWVTSEMRTCEGCWLERPAHAFSASGYCLEECDPP